MSFRSAVFATTFSLSLAGAFLNGCGDAKLEFHTPTPVPSGVDTTFRGGVLPTLQTRDCANASCHAIDGARASSLGLGGTSATANEIYDQIMAGGAAQAGGAGLDVDVDNPPASLLIAKPLEGSNQTHGGGKQFPATSDPGYLSILGWIESGAPNN